MTPRQFPSPTTQPRRRRCACVLAGLITFGSFVLPLLAEQNVRPEDRFRGGRFEWVRLEHGGRFWNRHAESDNALLSFLRSNTTLNVDPVWHATSARDLAALTGYPFLFADTLQFLNKTEQRNLAEYLRRGGFLFLSACVNLQVNPTAEGYLRENLRILGAMFPDFHFQELGPEHEVFSIYFKMEQFPPQLKGTGWSSGPTNPLRLLYAGDRVIGIMAISGLQCIWAGYGNNPIPSGKMLTNIYLYAITH